LLLQRIKRDKALDAIPKQIPDPEAKLPDGWASEEDGEWAAPRIDNPEYKEPKGVLQIISQTNVVKKNMCSQSPEQVYMLELELKGGSTSCGGPPG
jgi:hypothetical protein